MGRALSERNYRLFTIGSTIGLVGQWTQRIGMGWLTWELTHSGTWLGLTTLKPSGGRVPLDAPYLGRAAGPMARSAGDAALLLSVIARPDSRDW